MEKCTVEVLVMLNISAEYIEQRWNDFACETDKSVDLWRNDVFYSKSMNRIVRECSLLEDHIWLEAVNTSYKICGESG